MGDNDRTTKKSDLSIRISNAEQNVQRIETKVDKVESKLEGIEDCLDGFEHKMGKFQVSMEAMNDSVKQSRDSQEKIFEIQGKTLSTLTNIENCLQGTEYERAAGGGGLVKKVGILEKAYDDLKTWKTKTNTRNVIIWFILTGSATTLGGFVLANWEKIFK